MTAWEAGRDPDPRRPTGELLADLVDELRRLAHAEVRLALTETRRKVRRAGIGIAAFGAAALLGLGALGVLIASATLALMLVVSPWLAALLAGVGVLLLAGLCAMVGRFAFKYALPIKPERTVESVHDDVEVIKKGART